jgi:hypothetical protein
MLSMLCLLSVFHYVYRTKKTKNNMAGAGKLIDKKFNGKNFVTWRRQAKDFLVIKKLSKYITGNEAKSSSKKQTTRSRQKRH